MLPHAGLFHVWTGERKVRGQGNLSSTTGERDIYGIYREYLRLIAAAEVGGRGLLSLLLFRRCRWGNRRNRAVLLRQFQAHLVVLRYSHRRLPNHRHSSAVGGASLVILHKEIST